MIVPVYKDYSAKEIGLKPCPYCGNKDVRLIDDDYCWFVWCTNIDCKRKIINCYGTKEEAVEDWRKECERIAVC